MELLRVDVECLRVMASECETVAAKLATVTPTQSVPAQVGSAVAVNTAHADVAVAAGKLIARMKATAATLAIDSDKFAENEGHSARELHGIAGNT
jgi:hypothetical protein